MVGEEEEMIDDYSRLLRFVENISGDGKDEEKYIQKYNALKDIKEYLFLWF